MEQSEVTQPLEEQAYETLRYCVIMSLLLLPVSD